MTNEKCVQWEFVSQFCSDYATLLPPGGCGALLSEVPAAGHWSSSVCCSERKHRQGAGLLQKVLLREGVRGSRGLASPSPNSNASFMWMNKLKQIVDDFSYLQRHFYGPQERWMFLSMFLRVGVWRNLWRAYRRGFGGNLKGEGLVLGGVFVIGPGNQVGTCTMWQKQL